MQNGAGALRRWREFLIALAFFEVLAVVLDLKLNAIAALGVIIGGVVILIGLGLQAARGRP